MEVKCKKNSCSYNKNFTCMAKDIKVNFCQSCVSFKPDDNDQKNQKKGKFNKFEVGEELFDYIRCPNKEVKCDSYDCSFNKSSFCNANGITVNPEGGEPVCVSYIKK